MAGLTYAGYLGVHAVALALNAGIIAWVYYRDFGEIGRYFLFALSAGFVHSAVGGVLLAQQSTAYADVLFPAVGVLSWTSTTAWLLFVIHYTNRRHLLTRPVTAGIVGLYTVAVALTGTNAAHGLVYSGYEIVTTPHPHPEPVEGPLYAPLTTVGFLVALTYLGMLLFTALRARNLGRRQTTVVTATFGTTVAVALALRFGLRSIPPSVGAVVFYAGFAYLMSKERMLTVRPVTRTALMESMEDALVAVTDEGLVVDYNDAAADLFPALPDCLGDPVGDAVPALAPLSGGDPPERAAADGGTAPGSRAGDGPRADAAAALPRKVTVDADDGERTMVVEVTDVARRGTRGKVVVLRDVTDLERQTEQLDRFASVVSHDLRNPLNVATMYLDELNRRTDAREATVAMDALERMDEMIDDALTLARQGQVVEEPEPVTLGAAARDAWRVVDTGSVEFEDDTGDAVVVADEPRLRTLFENLYRNAIEHGAEDGDGRELTVRVGTLDGEAGFFVADTGTGIPDDKKGKVLEKGYTTNDDGTGLGLAIVQSVVGAHGWTVSVTDGAEGGARFEVRGVGFTDADADPEADPDPDADSGAVGTHGVGDAGDATPVSATADTRSSD